MTDNNKNIATHSHSHNQIHGSEGNCFAHLSLSSPKEHDDDNGVGRVAVDRETTVFESAGPVVNCHHRSHPNEAHHLSDCDRKEDRRSSLRGTAKRRPVNSPRWRDQQELPRRHGAQDGMSSSDHPHGRHSRGLGAVAAHQDHNDSASQTSHTDSHHSSLAASSDGELAHGQHPFKDRQSHHLHPANALFNNPQKFASAHHDHDNDSNSEGRLTPSHNNLSIHPIIHSETRFPTAMGYAPSEAAKSDIATVCSGSVIEDIDKDIDMASVASGDFPHASSSSAMGAITNALLDRLILKKTALEGSTGLPATHNVHSTATATATTAITTTTTTTVHHHPTTSHYSFNKHHRGDSNNATPRGVEFASHTHTYPIHQNDPSHYVATYSDTEPINPSSASASASDRSLLNDMGPPLSRTLLLVATAAANGETADHRHAVEGSYSRAGSVRSFSTGEAPSDVVAHVDTDDCGGSINLSEVSQEDHKERNLELAPSNSTIREPQNLGDAQTNVATSTNGRVSPGGTIYKGKGVRRYQGRYMKLPLKRFHQGEFNETVAQNPLQEREELYLHGDSDNDVPAQPPQWDDWSNSGYRSLSRSFSRSISPRPSRSRSRSHSESPRDNMCRRRPSWSPHRGSDRNNRRPIQRAERESPMKDATNESWSPPNRDFEPNRRPARRNNSPLKDVESKHEENDGRWHRDHWNNRGGRRETRSRSRSRASPRRSTRCGRKRKGSRSRS